MKKREIFILSFILMLIFVVVLGFYYFLIKFFPSFLSSDEGNGELFFNEKLVETAIKLNNPDVCNDARAVPQIMCTDVTCPGTPATKEQTIIICKAEYYGKIGDVEGCDNLRSSLCFNLVAQNPKDLETCDKIPINLYPDSFTLRHWCYENLAKIDNDYSVCLNIPEYIGDEENYRGSRTNCLVAFGMKSKNIKVCDNLFQSQNKFDCLKKVK